MVQAHADGTRDDLGRGEDSRDLDREPQRIDHTAAWLILRKLADRYGHTDNPTKNPAAVSAALNPLARNRKQ
jgi:hypothetical protein